MTNNELLEIGTNYLRNGKFKEALEIYLKASQNGSYLATYNVACMYYFGDGVEKDLNKALDYYILAGSQGDKEAMSHAGMVALELGKDSVAREQLEKSAKLNSLAGLYNYGMFLIKNKEEGLDYIFKACELGNGIAMNTIGEFYENGINLEKDLNKAFTFYKKSADLRVNQGEANLARCYKEGIGVSKDLELAEKYLELSRIPYED